MWGYTDLSDVDIRLLVGRRIKAWRTRQGMSARHLSLQLGFSHGALNEYEGGQRELSYRKLWILADFFGITVEDLLGPPRSKDEHEFLLERAAIPKFEDDDE
ncbi:MAG: helix-turn-helix domain-containing protein [Gemmatimonadaceae bacterium]|nr:helix-turn-helix domain-containing protein [Gemmatimonadaceae bacterium]